MSTRSFIGFYDFDNPGYENTLGVYHHRDGYPSGIGDTLYHVAQIYDDLTILRDVLFEENAYSTLNRWDGNPDNLIGYDAYEVWEKELRSTMTFEASLEYCYKMPFGIYYDGERADPEKMKLSDVPESWCEYAYLILPEQRTLLVFDVMYAPNKTNPQDNLMLIGVVDFDQPFPSILGEE